MIRLVDAFPAPLESYVLDPAEIVDGIVVLSGEGSITFADGENVELQAGSVVRLNAGESTVWTIRAALRKIYLV
jgi:uncharacterized protein